MKNIIILYKKIQNENNMQKNKPFLTKYITNKHDNKKYITNILITKQKLNMSKLLIQHLGILQSYVVCLVTIRQLHLVICKQYYN